MSTRMRAMLLCHVRLFVTLWTVALQAPLSMGFSRQEYWSGLSCPPPGDLPDPGNEPSPLMSPALAGWFFTTSATWEVPTQALVLSKAPQIVPTGEPGLKKTLLLVQFLH